ncbi:MAG: hypothetical protein B7733_03490 [Myxococcales bacterium FL481]|nr:MAG: hypothetical protein B7733_03490 [Myxococcales bacterium FL481]
MATPQRRALVELHVSTVLLAGPGLFAQLIELPAATIIAARSAVATICVVVVLVALRIRPLIRPGRPLAGAIVTGLLLGLHWVTYFHAVQVSSVAVGMISLFTFPLLSGLLEPLFGMSRWHGRHLLSGAAVLVGVTIMAKAPAATPEAALGTGWGIASATCLALRNVVSRRLTRSTSPWQLALHQYAIATACGIVLGSSALPRVTDFAVELLVLGAVFTALAHTLVLRSLVALTATRAALISCLQPVYATLAAYLLLGEEPSPPTLFGGTIVLAVAVHASRRG